MKIPGSALFTRVAIAGALGLASIGFVASSASAATGPLWDIRARWGETNLPPGGNGQFTLEVRNAGDEAPNFATPLLISNQLPLGVKATNIHWDTIPGGGLDLSHLCSGVGTSTVSCSTGSASAAELVELTAASLPFPEGDTFEGGSGWLPRIFVDVEVDSGASGSGINMATVSGAGDPVPFADQDSVPFSATPAPFDVVPGSFLADNFSAAYPFGAPSRQAGDRPFELRVDFDLTQLGAVGPDTTRYIDSKGLLRTVEVTFPRGWIGNPEATPKCAPVDFADTGPGGTACPANTQVGYLNVRLGQGPYDYGRRADPGAVNSNAFSHVPIYNLDPPKGVPADFAFTISGFVQAHIYPTPDPTQDYAIEVVTPNISAFNLFRVRETQVTIWGVPGDPAHDRLRYYPRVTEGKEVGAPFGGAPIRPLLTNPSDCEGPNGAAKVRIDSYSDPNAFSPVQENSEPFDVVGCEDSRFRFEPKVGFQPTSRDAGGPTGLDVHLEVPQRDDTVIDATDLYAVNGDVQAIATPPIRKAIVKMPEGMTISPSAAQGLASCSLEQIGLDSDSPVRCPDASQFGTLTLHTPILPENSPPKGRVYIAEQHKNPFDSFLALYLAIEEPERGILVKVAGKVELDSVTGQVTTTFEDLPQFPVSDMEMNLKGGVRAGLVNPQTCGTKTIEATFYSWHDPATPRVVKDSYEITNNPDGSPCVSDLAQRVFDPTFSAGTINPRAGAFSPLGAQLTRTDAEHEFVAVEAEPPPGLVASLRGVARCSEAQIEAAKARDSGHAEQVSPSCPSQSLVGTVDAGAGVGQVLTYVKGRVYLAGPYAGAPLSGVTIVPAVAGPFDLGVIVVRAPVYVDPRTARIRLTTDPLPQIIEGIPVRARDIRVHLDRERFILNPTNCEEMSFAAALFGTGGKTKQLSNRFQVGDCARLGLRPKFSLRLTGGTKRGDHPSLRATLEARPGDANIAGARVKLSRAALLDQGHIRTVCTRVQFAQRTCPAGSIYGHARATTPILDETLQGPVYLRSSNRLLPDLVVDLRGPSNLPIAVELIGHVDAVRGALRNTFDVVPDAPVSKFVLTLQGGEKGLIVNSRNLCTKPQRALVRFKGQNGRQISLRPRIRASCKRPDKR